MSNDPHAERPRHRHRRGRWLRSWLNRLPEKLVSKQFNIYQAVVAVLVGYLAFRVLVFLGVGMGVE
jgi:hypothetical protein